MSDCLAGLRLVHARGVGPKTVEGLYNVFGSLPAIVKSSDHELKAAGLSEAKIEALKASEADQLMEADLRWAEADQHHIISYDCPAYPDILKRIPSPPIVLYAVGDIDVLHTHQLAIVGSRNPTQSGKEAAYEFSKYLAQVGLTVTSGLALGVDTAAHQGALAAAGLTIAVAATGLDRVYPAQNRTLARELVREGVVVSEMPIGTRPRPEFFPRRNRIISGLSIGTLVVEAALHSGSLSTARHAMQQNREVFGIPGSIHSPLSRGCHALIRQGAKLVETAEHILEEVGALIDYAEPKVKEVSVAAVSETDREALDPAYQKLLDVIDFSPQPVDKLIERSGLRPEEVASMLLILELDGHITAAGGGKYVRAS